MHTDINRLEHRWLLFVVQSPLLLAIVVQFAISDILPAHINVTFIQPFFLLEQLSPLPLP